MCGKVGLDFDPCSTKVKGCDFLFYCRCLLGYSISTFEHRSSRDPYRAPGCAFVRHGSCSLGVQQTRVENRKHRTRKSLNCSSCLTSGLFFFYYYESVKRELKIGSIYMSVGVMKDYKLKRRNLHASHTLGWSWNWNT